MLWWTLVAVATAEDVEGAEPQVAPAVEVTAPELVADPAPGVDTGLADDLYARGWYDAAWLEYERAAYHLGVGPDADRARFLAGASLWGMGREADAADHYHLMAERVDPALVPLFLLCEAESRYRLGDLTDADRKLEALIEGPGDYADLATYRRAWIALRQGAPDAAAATLDAVPEGDLSASAAGLAEELRGWEPLPTRDPRLAGVFSAVLPGAGQLWVGEPRDALTAFLINGLLIGATVELARRHNWVATGGTGLAAVGFYAGNIFSAVNAAQRRNRRLERSRMAQVSADWELHLEPTGELELAASIGEE